MKAKTCIKKILSLIVVLVMLLTMIPVGMISVSADDVTPTIDLSDYENAEEYVIMNTADWLLIAESDEDFYGITVKLGADIDAGGFTEVLNPERFDPISGENLPGRADGKKPTSGVEELRDDYAATFPTLFKNFAGTFDGQGYTIKNARVEEGLIAAITLDGAEIKNVNVVDCQCCDIVDWNDYGLVVGIATGSLTIDNVNVVRGFVPATTFNSVHFNGGGGLVGLADAAEDIDDALLKITNCSIEADVHTGGEHTAVATNVHGTGTVIGTVNPNFDLEMTNCDISGNIDTYAFYAGAIGLLHVGEGRYVTIENINIDGVDYTADRGSFTWGGITQGALIGALSPRDYAEININKINVTNAVIGRNSCGVSGGLIGTIQALDSEHAGNSFIHTAPVIGAEINISNAYVVATVMQVDLGSSNASYGGAGGLIGQIGEGDSTNSVHTGKPFDSFPGRIFRGDININNCYVGSTVMAGWVASNSDYTVQAYDQGAGGLFAYVSAATAEIYVSDIVIDVDFPYNQIIHRNADGTPYVGDRYAVNSVGLISFAGHTRCGYEGSAFVVPGFESGEYGPGADNYYEVYLNVNDVVTTFQGDIYSVVHLNRKGGIHYNGVDIGVGDKKGNQPYTDPSIVSVRPIVAQQMVKLDENGFIDVVTGALGNASNVQVTAAADGTVDMRFIALAYVDAISDASATVIVKDFASEEIVKTFTFDELVLLDELSAVADTEIEAYTTKEFGAKKAMAVTIKNVPVGTKYEFEWSFSYTTETGSVVGNELEGTLAADGTFTNGVERELN